MAKKVDFKVQLKDELKIDKNIEIANEIKKDEVLIKHIDKENSEEQNTTFIISKKVIKKTTKKSFPLYMESDKLKELDKTCKASGYNRNELINMMIDFCLQNMKLK